MNTFPSHMSSRQAAMVRLRSRASLFFVLASVVVGTPGLADAPDAHASSPTLLLDLGELGKHVDPGYLLAQVGGAWLFWLDELDYPGNEDDDFLDGSVRFALWRTDGSREGTYPLLPPEVSFFYYAGSLDDIAFLVVCRPDGPIVLDEVDYLCNRPLDLELWATDGTREGTYRLAGDHESALPATSSRITLPVPELGLFFFITWGRESGYKLWASDGTPEGTRIVESTSDSGLLSFWNLAAFEGEVFFLTSEPHRKGPRLSIGRTDGTAGGARFFPAPVRRRVWDTELVPTVDRLFLVVERNLKPGREDTLPWRTLWKLKKNKKAFHFLGVLGSQRSRFRPFYAFAAPNRVFFSFFYRGLSEFWSTDGKGPPVLFADAGRGSGSPEYVWVEPWALSGGRAFFKFYDKEHGYEPWITDGTPAGTERLADLCATDCSSSPYGLGVFGDSYLFQAEDDGRGRELWRWRPEVDAPGTVELVADLCPGSCSSWPTILERVGDRLILAASEESGAIRLWTLGPGTSGAQLLTGTAELKVGLAEHLFIRRVIQARLIGNRLVFWATDDEGHRGLWVAQDLSE